jgi:hypothetical protein
MIDNDLCTFRGHIPTMCIDPIYLDPPCRSNSCYDVSFRGEGVAQRIVED